MDDSGHKGLPDGVMHFRLSGGALDIASAVLQVVKKSPVMVTQLVQENTAKVPEAVMNGLVSEKEVSLTEHYQAVQKFSKHGHAMYMHNKSLIEVVGGDLTQQLYHAVQPLDQDVLVKYPLLYISDNPKSSSDVLVGSEGSWSPLHQDLPLFCTSVILVLEGYKEFVVVADDVVPSLRVNITAASWKEPFRHNGQVYPDLQSLVTATGGAVLPLRAGDLMVMAPRVFHLARNCANTVSCNFSVCRMDNVPITVSQTLARIEKYPRDVMHFDSDFTRLLVDCTRAVLEQDQHNANSISSTTSRKRLPAVQSVLDSSVRLIEWYMTLQCIPHGWVEGFWGDVRDSLLSQLLHALPLHNREGPAGSGGGGGRSAKAAGAEAKAAAATISAAARAGGTRTAGAAAAAAARPRGVGKAAAGKQVPPVVTALGQAQVQAQQQEQQLRSDAAGNGWNSADSAGGDMGVARKKAKTEQGPR